MLYNPLEQFEIQELIRFKLGDLSLSLLNSGYYLMIGIVTIIIVGRIKTSERILSQRIFINEIIYQSLNKLVKDQIGKSESKYIGLIYALFSIILMSNVLGMIPYSFTVTSHFSVTLGMSVAIVISVTILGLIQHKLAFFSILIPSGTPIYLVPVVSLLELLSLVAKAISLGVRLAANCLAGHTLLKIISSFSWKLTSNSLIVPLISFPFLIGLIGLELGIAFLQSYVFTILTCSYIRESLHLH